jgi:hypothetical protein
MFFPAGDAPGGKNVEQHWLALEIGAGQALIVANRRQREFRQGLVNQHRSNVGGIMPEAQHESPDHGDEKRHRQKEE